MSNLVFTREGETSNYYRSEEFPSLLFIERTDRFTIDDIQFPDRIFMKGVAMNLFSNSWMQLLERAGIVRNQLVATDAAALVQFGVDESFAGRMVAVKSCIPIPLECIVRGYYVEDSQWWAPYKINNIMYGNVLPENLKNSQQLPNIIYSPSTKAPVNVHDVNISFATSIDVIKSFLVNNFDLKEKDTSEVSDFAFEVASAIRDTAVRAYMFAHSYALSKDIIIADAKLEFGLYRDPQTKKFQLLLIDEAFTPDTCRYWDKNKYQIGNPQKSMDKHLIRRYVYHNLKWNGTSNPPLLQDDILEEASDTYWKILERLFGLSFVDVTTEIAWDWHNVTDSLIMF